MRDVFSSYIVTCTLERLAEEVPPGWTTQDAAKALFSSVLRSSLLLLHCFWGCPCERILVACVGHGFARRAIPGTRENTSGWPLLWWPYHMEARICPTHGIFFPSWASVSVCALCQSLGAAKNIGSIVPSEASHPPFQLDGTQTGMQDTCARILGLKPLKQFIGFLLALSTLSCTGVVENGLPSNRLPGFAPVP